MEQQLWSPLLQPVFVESLWALLNNAWHGLGFLPQPATAPACPGLPLGLPSPRGVPTAGAGMAGWPGQQQQQLQRATALQLFVSGGGLPNAEQLRALAALAASTAGTAGTVTALSPSVSPAKAGTPPSLGAAGPRSPQTPGAGGTGWQLSQGSTSRSQGCSGAWLQDFFAMCLALHDIPAAEDVTSALVAACSTPAWHQLRAAQAQLPPAAGAMVLLPLMAALLPDAPAAALLMLMAALPPEGAGGVRPGVGAAARQALGSNVTP